MSKYHDVVIKKVSNGYSLKVGCVDAVFNDQKEMFKELKAYWKNPKEAEKKYGNPERQGITLTFGGEMIASNDTERHYHRGDDNE